MLLIDVYTYMKKDPGPKSVSCESAWDMSEGLEVKHIQVSYLPLNTSYMELLNQGVILCRHTKNP